MCTAGARPEPSLGSGHAVQARHGARQKRLQGSTRGPVGRLALGMSEESGAIHGGRTRATRRIRAEREDLRDRVQRLSVDSNIPAIGPKKDPVAWKKARLACRKYVITAARERDVVYYDELRALTYEVTGMTLASACSDRCARN